MFAEAQFWTRRPSGSASLKCRALKHKKQNPIRRENPDGVEIGARPRVSSDFRSVEVGNPCQLHGFAGLHGDAADRCPAVGCGEDDDVFADRNLDGVLARDRRLASRWLAVDGDLGTGGFGDSDQLAHLGTRGLGCGLGRRRGSLGRRRGSGFSGRWFGRRRGLWWGGARTGGFLGFGLGFQLERKRHFESAIARPLDVVRLGEIALGLDLQRLGLGREVFQRERRLAHLFAVELDRGALRLGLDLERVALGRRRRWWWRRRRAKR